MVADVSGCADAFRKTVLVKAFGFVLTPKKGYGTTRHANPMRQAHILYAIRSVESLNA